MERYSGFFWHRGAARVFRAWHEPWQSVETGPHIGDLTLVTTSFPWFPAAKLVEARLCAKSPNVWLGGPHRLAPKPRSLHGPSAFFDLP